MYKSIVNLIEHLDNLGLTHSEPIAIKYDLQAKSCIKYPKGKPEYTEEYASEIAGI